MILVFDYFFPSNNTLIPLFGYWKYKDSMVTHLYKSFDPWKAEIPTKYFQTNLQPFS